ncbi:MAG: YncE family protein [Acidobacteria bacterium]|jgi:DNA-binding beta-propeller fold protein YncE|nr:YncE family protein [Acidobacteriota bacterium]
MTKHTATLCFSVFGAAVLCAVAPSASTEQAREQARPAYYAYVCAESDDTIALVRFRPSGPGQGTMDVVKTIDVGIWPTEIEGPHGIAIHPDGKSWFVSLSHGTPYGSIHKYATGSDEFIDSVPVGLFPATLTVSPATGFLYVVNFNLYGLMEPSSVSVVDTTSMSEIAQVPTGVMPHGSRLDVSGTKHYSVSMMDDHLWEIDGLSFEVARKLPLSEHAAHMATMDMASEAGAAMMKSMKAELAQPTWATPTASGMVYVAGNNSNVIYEVDVAKWEITRRFENTTAGPYNLDVTADGRLLVATYKKSAAIGIWDLTSGKEVANIKTTRTIPHGVVISPDSNYAFVTLEGVGGEPGTVEVYDLATLSRAATVDVGKQAGGLAFWKIQ